MNPWKFLLVGYLTTIAVEAPILLLGLSPRHPLRRRLVAGVWLTACTYPIVVLTMPGVLYRQESDRAVYLLVAETFAPAAECAIFWLAFGDRKELGRRSMWWDFAAIVLANLASFAAGEALHRWPWWTGLSAG